MAASLSILILFLLIVISLIDITTSKSGQPGLVVASKFLEDGLSVHLLILPLLLVPVDAFKLLVQALPIRSICSAPLGQSQ